MKLQNWPYEPGPGGWVVPHDDPIVHWTVARVHARYVAPEIGFDERDEHGRRLTPRPELHAYHVDLTGDGWDLRDHGNVLLYQEGRGKWWWIKTADEEHLARIERYRVAD